MTATVTLAAGLRDSAIIIGAAIVSVLACRSLDRRRSR